MTTDLERRLSELLDAAVPEPPTRLTPPTVADLAPPITAQPSPSGDGDADAVVVPLIRTRPARRPWRPLAVAASAAVLLGGIVAGLVAVTHDHGTSPAPAASRPPTSTPPGAGTPWCNAQLVIGLDQFGGRPVRVDGDSASVGYRFSYFRRSGHTPCRLRLQAPRIRSRTTAVAPWPAGTPHVVTLTPSREVHVLVRMQASGPCRRTANYRTGARITVSTRTTNATFPLLVRGCALTPTGLSVHVRG